ncbi:hypothetical protein EUTSA_v10020999mg [Eutrema salsugineum]|uniref:WEB family protein n=1 Tax=Eutrema salsugineum TaxID=72664 RepID=V4LE16_EUTSA|nr:WEB family protein At3g13190 [Eutrema salsugineum]XP_024015403.1 WEB family protein At3g13190 [Eutrema salsugineum]XP_024015404.1 WEB family protein At3g13190 [Eutrema salsugineum]ESQ48705.1 hypothetical protein EUTSA_v10020999mg [Eutrema salsugineum]
MATFHSVKDAVKLLDAGFAGGKHLNNRQEQGVLAEETNLCFWNKEINKLKEKIKNADMAKTEALLELEEAKKTIEHLNHKLGIRRNMRNDKEALDLSSNVRVVTSELGFAKVLLQRVAEEEESQLGIRQNMRNEKALDLSGNVSVVTSELGVAKESLHRVAEEESELFMLMESLKLELQNVKKEHSQLKENEQRETDQAIEELKKEAEDAKTELLLLEEELKIALFEAEEEGKPAEEHGKERLNVQETLDPQSDERVVAEVKESVGELTETEALRACRDELLKKLEMSEREIEDIKAATQDALKKAEMAKEATVVVDAELKRRRKAASRILAESKMCAKSFPSAKEVHKSKTRSKETCLVKC